MKKLFYIAVLAIITACSAVVQLPQPPENPVYSFAKDSIAADVLTFYQACSNIEKQSRNFDIYDFTTKKLDVAVVFNKSQEPGAIRERWIFFITDTVSGMHTRVETFYDHFSSQPNVDLNKRIEGVKSRILSHQP